MLSEKIAPLSHCNDKTRCGYHLAHIDATATTVNRSTSPASSPPILHGPITSLTRPVLPPRHSPHPAPLMRKSLGLVLLSRILFAEHGGPCHSENSSSKTYQAYREHPIRLCAARNACLAGSGCMAWPGCAACEAVHMRGARALPDNALRGPRGRAKGSARVGGGVREEFDAIVANDPRTAGSPISDTDEWERGEAVANGSRVCLGRAPGGDVEVYIDLRGCLLMMALSSSKSI